LLIVNNRDYFASNSAYHSNNTRNRNDLHLPQVTLAKYQKDVYYSGIKTFNGLPKAITDISSKPHNFKIALKPYLYTHSIILQMNFLTNSNILHLLCLNYPSSYTVQLYYFSLYLLIIHCSFTFH